MPEDKEEFSIYCVDAYGDGWHGGYLEINGEKYCDDFDSGFSATDSMSTGFDLFSSKQFLVKCVNFNLSLEIV